jgi:hypothetical protein
MQEVIEIIHENMDGITGATVLRDGMIIVQMITTTEDDIRIQDSLRWKVKSKPC